MIVKQIQATGMKGQNFRHTLAPLTCIVGPNFSGKTARLAAIQLALLGYIPGSPPKRTNAAIIDFATGTGLSVEAHLSDDDTAMSRRFWREKGSVKSAGTEDVLTVPLLDAGAFFKAGPTDQLAYMFSAVTLPAEYTVDGIIAGVKAVKIEEPTEETEKALGEIAEKVRFGLSAEGATLQDNLAALVKEKGVIRTIVSYQKKRAADTIGHVRTAMALRAREGECSADTLGSIEAALEKAKATLAAANTAKGALDQRSKASSQTATRRAELEKVLAAPGRNFASEITTEEITLKSARAMLATLVKPEGIEADLDAAWQTARNELAKCAAAGNAAKAKVEEIDKAVAEAVHLAACPFCQSDQPGWNGNLVQKYQAEMEVARKAHADATAKYPTVAAAEKAARQALAALRQYVVDERQARVAVATSEMVIATLTQKRDAAVDLMAAKKAELDGLQATEGPTEQEVEAALDRQMRATDDVEAIESLKDTAVALAQEIKRAAESAMENTTAIATQTVAEAVLAHLKTTQAAMIEKGIGPTIQRANALFGAVLKSPLAFHDGDIGRWEGAQFIKAGATFSGAEEALTFVAISAALSSSATMKLAVIDEFDRLDEPRQDAVIVAFEDAVARGDLDQVIIAGPSFPPGIDGNAWTLIKL